MDNNFILFKNTRRAHDRMPHFTGRLTLAGVEYEIAAWKHTDKKGDIFLSGRVTARDETEEPTPQETAKKPEPTEDFNDDIPF